MKPEMYLSVVSVYVYVCGMYVGICMFVCVYACIYL